MTLSEFDESKGVRKMRKLLIAFLLVFIFVFATFPVLAKSENSNGSEKVDICHLENKSSTNYHLINVSGNAVKAHLGHGDVLQGALIVNPDQLSVDVTYFGHWFYTANFVRTGTVLTGSLTDNYVPNYTRPITNGSIIGNHVIFSFDYGQGSVQGVRTYEGDIQPTGDLTGLWSQTGSQNTNEKFAFTIANFATNFICE
jgi:hypothetical protein